MAPEDVFQGPIFLGKGAREQYKGIHDEVNDQGFVMHYRAISNTTICKFSAVREAVQQSKRMD